MSSSLFRILKFVSTNLLWLEMGNTAVVLNFFGLFTVP